MKAIILAAGVGKRFHKVTEHLPKCLIPIGGKSLLERTLLSLRRVGLSEAILVVGYLEERIRQRVGSPYRGVEIHYRVNEAYHRGAILSLWRAREAMDEDLLIMDADVLFPTAMLERLVCSPHPNCFLLDGRSPNTGEEQMLLTRQGRVLDIVRGGRGDFDVIGESVGFLKVCQRDAPRLRRIVEELIAQGQDTLEHEEAYRLFVRQCEVGYERVDDLPWIEIDFPEDLEKAEKEILPLLEAPD